MIETKVKTKEVVKKAKPSLFIRFAVTLLLMLGVFITAAVMTYVATVFIPKPPENYEECASARGSTIQESYPAVCVAKSGARFIQPLSEEEQKLLDSPLGQDTNEGGQGKFCGGIAGIACPTGYRCRLDGSYPDAGGTCTRN